MNLAIVGCGFVAKKHAKAIANISDANLVAVCDPVKENRDYFVKNYGAVPYASLDDLLERETIDIVSICTPTGLHAPLTIQAAEAKKHIILEKPMAMTLEEADQILRVVKANDVKLSVVLPNRYRPAAQTLKHLLQENRLGKISHINAIVNWNRDQSYYDQATWRGTKALDGGALMNQSIHNLDLMLWLIDEPVKEVFSMEATRLRQIEVEDVSNGLVRFESGILGLVQAATTVYPKNFEESITIFGEKGTVKIGGPQALHFKHLEIANMTNEELEALKQKIEADPLGLPGHQRIIEDMIKAVQQDQDPLITGHEARKSLALVLALYESAKLNQPISL